MLCTCIDPNRMRKQTYDFRATFHYVHTQGDYLRAFHSITKNDQSNKFNHVQKYIRTVRICEPQKSMKVCGIKFQGSVYVKWKLSSISCHTVLFYDVRCKLSSGKRMINTNQARCVRTNSNHPSCFDTSCDWIFSFVYCGHISPQFRHCVDLRQLYITETYHCRSGLFWQQLRSSSC